MDKNGNMTEKEMEELAKVMKVILADDEPGIPIPEDPAERKEFLNKIKQKIREGK